MSLPAELIFAKVRLLDFLTGKKPEAYTVADPTLVLDEIQSGFKNYLTGKGAPYATPDVRWVFNLPDSVPPESFGSVENLPEELVTDFTLVAQRALAYLQNLIPNRTLPGLALRSGSMTDAEKAKLRRAAAAIEDPVAVLSNPELLSSDHIEAIKEVYPDLYNAVGKMIGTVLVSLGRRLRPREDTALSRILGTPVHSLGVLNAKDQTQGPEGQAMGNRRPRGPVAKEPEIQTNVQRVADSSR